MPALVRKFGARGRIHFANLRNMKTNEAGDSARASATITPPAAWRRLHVPCFPVTVMLLFLHNWEPGMNMFKSVLILTLSFGAVATCFAQNGGNGNGGAGGGNAHAAATAAPTRGGDNTSVPTSTRKGGFHLKHKKKTPTTSSQ